MDYQKIIDELDIDSFIARLKDLGIEPEKETDDYFQFKTVCHNASTEDCSDKLYFYKDTKLFVCYTNCQGMSVFNFLKHFYETRQIEYDWFEDIYSPIVENSSIKKKAEFEIPSYTNLRSKYKREKLSALPVYSDKVLDCFIEFYVQDWIDDGISIETMKKFGILYSISQNKIIIPHLDKDGRLVGIRGRALDPWEIENLGKYMPVKVEQTWYKHPLSLNLYGLYQNKENIRNSGICYLFEGEKSVLICEDFSRPNCAVACCGSNFNKFALKILMQECAPREIVICFDKEEQNGQDIYFNKLMGICKRYSNYTNFSFIYDVDNLLNLKDSPVDRGEEIFNQLLKRRIRIK